MATQKVREGWLYVYNPVGMDLWDSRSLVPAGTMVRVVNLPGCPKANTMGHAHIEDVVKEKFAGLVLTNSLRKPTANELEACSLLLELRDEDPPPGIGVPVIDPRIGT